MSRLSKAKTGPAKISQDALRRFMNAEKQKLAVTAKRVDSPLAKYLENGTLTCIVCDSVVRSESVWPIHLNSKLHKENVLLRKQEVMAPRVVAQPAPPPPTLKRPPSTSTHSPNPPKKIKGILKNAPALPADFFDDVIMNEAKSEAAPPSPDKMEEEESEGGPDAPPPPAETAQPPKLPEGFFDDPIEDARARNVEYKDPIQEEWDRFMKEIQEENTVSTQLIQDDTEVATVERQIVEVDEQLRKWSRVLDLEVKKEQVKSKTVIKARDIKREESESEDDNDPDEFLDWRAKRAFK